MTATNCGYLQAIFRHKFSVAFFKPLAHVRELDT
jgi:hypothetical protein